MGQGREIIKSKTAGYSGTSGIWFKKLPDNVLFEGGAGETFRKNPWTKEV